MKVTIAGIRRKIVIAIAALALLGANAHATTFTCQGQISRSIIYGNGNLMIVASWRGSYTQLCNIHQEWLGISAEVCRSWHAMIESAKARQANTLVQYTDANFTCSTLPTYGASIKPNYLITDD